MVDMELDVSEETVDNGRGMNSTVSEKTTRGRGSDGLARPDKTSRRLGGDSGGD